MNKCTVNVKTTKSKDKSAKAKGKVKDNKPRITMILRARISYRRSSRFTALTIRNEDTNKQNIKLDSDNSQRGMWWLSIRRRRNELRDQGRRVSVWRVYGRWQRRKFCKLPSAQSRRSFTYTGRYVDWYRSGWWSYLSSLVRHGLFIEKDWENYVARSARTCIIISRHETYWHDDRRKKVECDLRLVSEQHF